MGIDDTGIILNAELRERHMAWEEIEKVEVTQDHAFVYSTPFWADLIPRHSVFEGDFELFVQAVRTGTKDAGG